MLHSHCYNITIPRLKIHEKKKRKTTTKTLLFIFWLFCNFIFCCGIPRWFDFHKINSVVMFNNVKQLHKLPRYQIRPKNRCFSFNYWFSKTSFYLIFGTKLFYIFYFYSWNVTFIILFLMLFALSFCSPDICSFIWYLFFCKPLTLSSHWDLRTFSLSVPN